MKARPFAIALAGISLALATSAPADPADPAAQEVRVPIHLRNHKVEVPVTLEDSTRLRVVLDSGMAFEGLLLYDSARLDSSLRLRAGRARVGGGGSGEPSTALVVDSASFSVGGERFTGRLIALENSPLRSVSDDGVCGYSLFAQHVVELDYDRMELVLHAPGSFRPDSGWASVPLSFRENRIPWLDLEAGVRAGDSLSLACYVDLASSETVEFLTRDGMRFRLPDSLTDVLLGRGLSGDIRGSRGRIPWVRLGPFRVDDLVAAFTPAAVRSRQPGADAVVGNGLLGRFHCAFDYAAGRLYLRPSATPPR